MTEIKVEIVNGTNMSTLKVYFIMNLKLKFYVSDNITLKQKNEICYKLEERDGSTISKGRFNIPFSFWQVK